MKQSAFSEIEDIFSGLSVGEQLRLIERLVRRVQQNTKEEGDLNAQLALMATDPQIQSELQRIEAEFLTAEADGLETA